MSVRCFDDFVLLSIQYVWLFCTCFEFSRGMFFLKFSSTSQKHHKSLIILNHTRRYIFKHFSVFLSSQVLPQNAHNIQTHEVTIAMLDEASEMRKYQEIPPSPLPVFMDCSLLMTPPKTERKCLAPLNGTTV